MEMRVDRSVIADKSGRCRAIAQLEFRANAMRWIEMIFGKVLDDSVEYSYGGTR